METELLNIFATKKASKVSEKDIITKGFKRKLEWILICLLVFGYVVVSFAQTNTNEYNYDVISKFKPTIKDAFKFSDLPEIKDSVKRLQNIKYGIASAPMFPKYQVQTIGPAKMQNEPLTKLYNSILKVGYSPIYNMPYGEFWIANKRNKDKSFGAHLKHLSSTAHLEGTGYGGYSDNVVNIFGKQFYKKHTLSGDLNYERNVIHYYGYDTSQNKISDNNYTKQRYQLLEPKLRLTSHYTDSTHINHDIGLSFYNLQNLNRESESNVKLSALGSLFINKEKLNIGFATDYYNHKQSADTLNDLIVSLNPSFEANGKKWHANVGLSATLDQFKNTTRFYFYPQLNVHYDVYENMVIPYAGVNGGLMKNSFKTLSKENPFVDSTLRYANTDNKYNAFIGLRGNLSSNSSYDAKVSYAQYDSMHFYVIDYNSNIQLHNRFNLVYDNTTLLTISGQIKNQVNEKFNVITKGNYYIYKLKNIIRAYQKPDFDLTLSAIYNMQSKIILRADIFAVGNQWALSPANDGTNALKPKQINGWIDANFEAEYRYTKMLSFFARFNNIANQRFYRWDRYPSQRFNFMVGLTFVPF
jgi:hypothetical protein